MLTRAQFMVLNRLDSDGFTALKRRNILPLLSSTQRNQYSVLDALLTRVLLEICQEFPAVSQVAARSIIDLISPEIPKIVNTLKNETDPGKQIHGGVLVKQYPAGSTPFVGTLQEMLAAQLSGPATVKQNTVNLTLCAEAMRQKARNEGIDLGGF